MTGTGAAGDSVNDGIVVDSLIDGGTGSVVLDGRGGGTDPAIRLEFEADVNGDTLQLIGTAGPIVTAAGSPPRLLLSAFGNDVPSVIFDGDVQLGGAVTGVLPVLGNVAFSPTDTLSIDLDTTSPGLGNDLLFIDGSVNLGDAALAVTLASPVTRGDTFLFIDNFGADPVAGTFAGLAEGGLLTVGGEQFRISYVGGDGNDVTLEAVTVVGVTVAPDVVTEDGVAVLTYTFTRSSTTGPLSVDFTVAGDATFGDDYVAGGADAFTAMAGSITFNDGEATATLTLDPINDLAAEPDETVVLTLVASPDFVADTASASATGTITSDDFDVRIDAAGNLILDDPDGSQNDDVTIVVDGANYRITDPNNILVGGPGSTADGANSVLVPIASVTGSIMVTTRGGDDRLNIDRTGGDLSHPVVYDGGAAGNDTLSLLNGTATDLTFTYVNENDGSVQIDSAPAISYVGLEPITSTIDAVNVTLNYSDAAETITDRRCGRRADDGGFDRRGNHDV